MSYFIENIRRIYDSGARYYWEVRPDGDGLGMEIVYNEGGPNDKDQPPGAIAAEPAKLIAQAMLELAALLEARP